MNRAIEKWVRASIAGDALLDRVGPPEFAHAWTARAYEEWEDRAVQRLRMGGPVWPDFHEQLYRIGRAMQTIDRAWSEPDGFVYMLSPDRESDFDKFGHVKIGFSADPESRVRQLQTGCHYALSIYRQAPGTAAVERALHGLLSEHRARGEWFRYSLEVEEVMWCLSGIASEWGRYRLGVAR